jgi:hypothetical protein
MHDFLEIDAKIAKFSEVGNGQAGHCAAQQ